MRTKINYRLLSIDNENHQVLVRYFTDNLTEEMLAIEFDSKGKVVFSDLGFPTRCRTDYTIDINLTDSASGIPTKNDIIRQIEEAAPRLWLVAQERLLNSSSNLNAANDIVNVVGSFYHETVVENDVPPTIDGVDALPQGTQ